MKQNIYCKDLTTMTKSNDYHKIFFDPLACITKNYLNREVRILENIYKSIGV